MKGLITYSSDKSFLANAVTITSRKAFEIINMNRRGEKPESLTEENTNTSTKTLDLVEQESLTRFDKKKGNNRKKKKKPTVSANDTFDKKPITENNIQEKEGTNKKKKTFNTNKERRNRDNRNATPNDKQNIQPEQDNHTNINK